MIIEENNYICSLCLQNFVDVNMYECKGVTEQTFGKLADEVYIYVSFVFKLMHVVFNNQGIWTEIFVIFQVFCYGELLEIYEYYWFYIYT
jgi:hypothetical protein